LKEEGKKEDQETAAETDLRLAFNGSVVRVGFGSVRGKGRQGGSLGRGVFLRI
jgi:hypothetical protein